MTALNEKLNAIINDKLGDLNPRESLIAKRASLRANILFLNQLIKARPELTCELWRETMRDTLDSLIEEYYKDNA